MKWIFSAAVAFGVMAPVMSGAESVVLGNGDFSEGEAEVVSSYSFPCPISGPFQSTNRCTSVTYGKQIEFTLDAPSEVHLQVNSPLDVTFHRSFDGLADYYRKTITPVPTEVLEDGTKTYVKLLSAGTYVLELRGVENQGTCCGESPIDRNFAVSAGWSALTAGDPRNSTKVFSTFDENYWSPESIAEVAEPPLLTINPDYLRLDVVHEQELPRFGYFETKEAMAPLPPGAYMIKFQVGMLISDASPDLRIRVFSENGLYQSMASAAKGELAPARRPTDSSFNNNNVVEVFWRSDGITPWKTAIDVLAFRPKQEGYFVIGKVDITPLSE